MNSVASLDFMDEECVRLCDAINMIPGLETIESCCGHGKYPFHIWFLVNDPKNLPILLYHCDACHVGFDWDCFVETDCGMSPVHYRLSSRKKGKKAYKESEIISSEIERFMHGNPDGLTEEYFD